MDGNFSCRVNVQCCGRILHGLTFADDCGTMDGVYETLAHVALEPSVQFLVRPFCCRRGYVTLLQFVCKFSVVTIYDLRMARTTPDSLSVKT